MENYLTLEKFIRFLKDNDVFYKYCKNLTRTNCSFFVNHKGFTYKFVEMLDRCQYAIIDRSLVWRNTDEGHDFWKNINRKLKELGDYDKV